MQNARNAKLATLFDSDFKRDKDKHKFALLWSSKAYELINALLRDPNVINNISANPGIAYFAKHFIDYFYTNGVMPQRIGAKTLYRGIGIETITHHAKQSSSNKHVYRVHDTGFASTSKDKHIAQEFAGRDGLVLKFKVSELPKIPFVIIDDTVSDHLLEEEVLFLPGTFKLDAKNTKGYAEYKCNLALTTMLRALDVQTGGGIRDKFKIPDLALHNKYAVYYRHVYDRPVEIISVVKFPKRARDVRDFLKREILSRDREYTRMTNFIPEYQDLADSQAPDARRKRASYYVLMAIYNPKTRDIEHYNYGHFDLLLQEAGVDMSRRPEVKRHILEHIDLLRACAAG